MNTVKATGDAVSVRQRKEWAALRHLIETETNIKNWLRFIYHSCDTAQYSKSRVTDLENGSFLLSWVKSKFHLGKVCFVPSDFTNAVFKMQPEIQHVLNGYAKQFKHSPHPILFKFEELGQQCLLILTYDLETIRIYSSNGQVLEEQDWVLCFQPVLSVADLDFS